MPDADRPLTREQSREVILNILRSGRIFTISQVIERFGHSDNYTRLLLSELEAEGKAERITGRRPVYWRATPHA